MISDDERRRVVAELRDASTGTYRHVDVLDVIAGSIGVDIAGKFSYEAEKEIYAALADLIDRPTTRRVCKNPMAIHEKWPCERCGFSIGDRRWKYCPNCGAEVVNDA